MKPVVAVQNISLAYRQYSSPKEALLEWLFKSKRHQTFYALKDISFKLEKGESLGIIGNNGAGKSSLLKLLAGNLHATSGKLQLHGTHSAILELGTAFHPDFSGLENAKMGLRLLGIDKQQIPHYLQQVIDFSELGDFIYQAVKTYSSGMTVRLAFAIAVVIQPDILIVDEALSVGDQYFQKKSLDKMRDILNQQATLIFCSHNLYQIKEMCTQAIWLDQGKIRLHGEVNQVVDAYQDELRGISSNAAATTATHFINKPAYINDIKLEGGSREDDKIIFRTGETFSVFTDIIAQDIPQNDIHLGLVIRRNDDIQCYGISTLHDNIPLQKQSNGHYTIRFIIEQLPLLSGDYCLEAWLIDASGIHIYDSRERCCYFTVRQKSQQQGIGMVQLEHRWE